MKKLYNIGNQKSTKAYLHPTVCVTGAGAGVDSPWEQKKLEARKMPKSAARTHRQLHAVLGSARLT